jgi:hypothetical protein
MRNKEAAGYPPILASLLNNFSPASESCFEPFGIRKFITDMRSTQGRQEIIIPTGFSWKIFHFYDYGKRFAE